MSKTLKLTALFLTLIYLVTNVNAFVYYGDSDLYDIMGMHGFGFIAGLGLFAILIGIFLFAFWLFMLIDCLKRDFKNDYEKIVWVLVMIFLHILGATIYYFVVKIPNSNGTLIRKKK